jgi:hypothetical protein
MGGADAMDFKPSTPQLQPRSAADPQAGAFWACLHHRITDQIAHGPIRGWLHAYAHLEPEERHGWPVLVLVLEAPPPADLEAVVIAHHYRKALADSAGKAGPLADLAKSVEVAR